MAASIYKNRQGIYNLRLANTTHYLFPKRRASVSIFGTMTIYLPNALKEINGNINRLADEIDRLFLTEFVCLTASGSAVIPLCEKLNRCPVIQIIKRIKERNN